MPDSLDALLAKIPLTPFLALPLDGGYPAVPSVASLPSPSELLRGQVAMLRGTPDTLWMCMQDTGGAYRWQLLGSGLVQRTYPAAISNDSTEKTLISYTVPAGALGKYGAVEFEMRGRALNNTGGNISIIPRVKWGGTTIYDSEGYLVLTDADKRGWVMRGRVVNLGATNSQAFDGEMLLSKAFTPTTGIGGLAVDATAGADNILGVFGSASDPAKDTTAAVALSVTMQLNTASASATWTTDYADVRLV